MSLVLTHKNFHTRVIILIKFQFKNIKAFNFSHLGGEYANYLGTEKKNIFSPFLGHF